jgi:glycyl-tRNA synthetase
LIEDFIPGKKVEGLPFSELEKIIEENKIPCPKCGKMSWTKIRKFNQLVEIKLGVLEEGKNLAYLRGEIAQGIFLNFKNVLDSTRVKIPFGIAQQGKAYRNEITMGQFVHRSFEFDLMEFEYFIKSENWEKVFEMWKEEMWGFALSLGIKEENLRWREHEEYERSHYSKKTMDIEYKYPSGFKEMFGIAYRTDFDLKNHAKNSGQDLSYTDPFTNEKYTPHVVEPTFGLSRLTGILLFNGYCEDGDRVVLKLNPKIAPYKVAVFPLLANKPELTAKAREIYQTLKKNFVVTWDDRGNIGKRYFAQDEIGTPWCITVDFKTLDDGMVTVRDRDTAKQERINIDKLTEYFQNRLG